MFIFIFVTIFAQLLHKFSEKISREFIIWLINSILNYYTHFCSFLRWGKGGGGGGGGGGDGV